MHPVVAILSGPERTRPKAELALEKANLTVIPPTEWPIQHKSYFAADWAHPETGVPHMTPVKLAYNPLTDEYEAPEGVDDSEDHGFLAVLAETEQAFHHAYDCVEKHEWVLRAHHDLPPKPEPNPLVELFERYERRIAHLESQLPVPPMAGGALESGAGFAMQAGSYAAAQTRRAVFFPFARTSANTPGLLSGGLGSPTDMQLSNAVSGLVVYTSVGECLIPGSEATSQGGYYAFNSTQNSTTLATANASNPRIDLICATAADAQYTIPSGGTSGSVTIQAVTGTPTTGATLSNLAGSPALPASSLLLGYVLVPAAATNLSSVDIANRATAAIIGTPIAGTVSQPSRSGGTAYQPNTQRATLVSVTVTNNTSTVGNALAYIGASSSPATLVGTTDFVSSSSTYANTMTFIVPVAWYYQITLTNAGLNATAEWVL